MRVAVVSTSYPLFPDQAAGHFVAAEAHALCAAGHDVVVVAPGPRASATGRAPQVLRVPGYDLFGPPGALARLRANPLRARGALAFIAGARRLLRQHGPFERLYAHWVVPCAWPVSIGLARDVEVVAHGSDVRLLCRLPPRVRRSIVDGLLRRGVTFRFASDELRAALADATTPSLRERSRVQPPALALPERPDRDATRSRLGIASRARLVLVIARLVPSKRVATALAAVACLPGVSVVVVGGGPLQRSLETAFPHVRFTGELPRSSALAWLGAADVLVSTSRCEGAPTVVREARAWGVPVVACAAGDLRSWAETDPGVWLVPDA